MLSLASPSKGRPQEGVQPGIFLRREDSVVGLAMTLGNDHIVTLRTPAMTKEMEGET
jgi:hypothetical protein